MGLYHDPETGQQISTHSMLKTMRRCAKQAEYKYKRRLKPKVVGKPLKRGTWFHKLLEAHYKGEDWREIHQHLSHKFNAMFDEEKDEYGDLPREMAALMRSYLWHYAADPWKILEVEFVLETEFPDGTIFRAKVDLLVENQFGLWIVDHKTHKSLPGLEYRILDSQSADYIWAALKCGIPVQGHIWNYVKAKVPGSPEPIKSGKRLSMAKLETDFPTFARAVKQHGFDPNDYAATLRMLKARRFQHGEPQTSPFFRRDFLEKSPTLLNQVAREAYHTSNRMHAYPFDRPEIVERSVDRSCTFSCSYHDICAAELWGANAEMLIRRRFTVADPMEYYYDDDRRWEEEAKVG